MPFVGASHYKSDRKWVYSELAAGAWIALGQDTDSGMQEVTDRRYTEFKMQERYGVMGGFTADVWFTGPYTFDTVMVFRTARGKAADILHNSRPLTADPMEVLAVTVRWEGTRVGPSALPPLQRCPHCHKEIR